jgi:DNA repair protein RadC
MDVLETNYVPLVRLHVVRERFLPYGKDSFATSETVVKMVKRLLDGADKESLLVIPVDAKNKPLGVEIAAMGAVNCVYAFARDIFKNAIVSNATGIFIVHNHVSGDVLPSEEDWKFTRCMQEAGDLLGVEVIDHIIIGEDDNYFSMHKTHRWEMRQQYVSRAKGAS